jgi:hypothetical protein
MLPINFGLKFFLFGGVILIVTAGLQLLMRQPSGRKEGMQRYVNVGLVRTVLFVTVGVLAILVGAGAIPIQGH